MRKLTITAAGVIAWAVLIPAPATAVDPVLKDAPTKDGFPRFKVQELATDLTVGYGVVLADVNGDKKPDIVVADSRRVIWYENPTWKVRTIIGAKTKPDNVCITAVDIDGGGDIEFVLGAGWRPSDTETPGTLQWLKRGKTLDEEWTVHPIPCDEPTVHRVRVYGPDRDGSQSIIMAPLHGRGCTPKGNYTDGRPVRVVRYKVPKDPADPKAWKTEVLSDELHVVHNFEVYGPGVYQFARDFNNAVILAAASFEGLTLVTQDQAGKRSSVRIGEGNQTTPKGNRGASEVAWGCIAGVRMAGGHYLGGVIQTYAFVTTIEPWHGNQVVVYRPDPKKPGDHGLHEPWKRQVIDDHLRWGHAVKCAFLGPTLEEDGTEVDHIIVGVRDDPNPKAGDKFTERRGVRLYRCTDGKGEKWDRLILDNGGIAVEDLAVGDLNGDGKPDIVAVGRQTKNVRVYWNQGK